MTIDYGQYPGEISVVGVIHAREFVRPMAAPGYTERYMWIPQENEDGYTAGSVMTYAANLKGRLMLYYGTADNNVHPNNMMQLITALNRANKSYEVQVGPDAGHSGVNTERMMEFFIDNLVLNPPK